MQTVQRQNSRSAELIDRETARAHYRQLTGPINVNTDAGKAEFVGVTAPLGDSYAITEDGRGRVTVWRPKSAWVCEKDDFDKYKYAAAPKNKKTSI